MKYAFKMECVVTDEIWKRRNLEASSKISRIGKY